MYTPDQLIRIGAVAQAVFNIKKREFAVMFVPEGVWSVGLAVPLPRAKLSRVAEFSVKISRPSRPLTADGDIVRAETEIVNLQRVEIAENGEDGHLILMAMGYGEKSNTLVVGER